MGDLPSDDDLRGYYEAESRAGTRKSPVGRRVEVRDAAVDRFRAEGRRRVLDLGAGPGSDTVAFASAGFDAIGIDLALGNGVLAAARGAIVVQASMADPPFPRSSFDAGWCMSALMHVAEERVPAVLAGVVGVFVSGAPIVFGLWGGRRQDVVDDERLPGHSRLFSLRTAPRNRELLGSVLAVETEDVWPGEPDGWEYQVFSCRVR